MSRNEYKIIIGFVVLVVIFVGLSYALPKDINFNQEYAVGDIYGPQPESDRFPIKITDVRYFYNNQYVLIETTGLEYRAYYFIDQLNDRNLLDNDFKYIMTRDLSDENVRYFEEDDFIIIKTFTNAISGTGFVGITEINLRDWTVRKNENMDQNLWYKHEKAQEEVDKMFESYN